MFPMVQFIDKQPTYRWDGRQIVRELAGRPHLLTRIEVRGAYFPHMGREPFMRVVDADGAPTRAWFTNVCDRGECVRGYFPVDLTAAGVLEFGYGADVVGRIEFDPSAHEIDVLDRERIPGDLVVATAAYIATQRGADETAD